MNQSKNNALQGLRFWAITLIIASHCGLLYQGGVGNTIFFALSGFLLCRPFADESFEYRYFKVGTFLKYYYKRILRIFPVAWVCMFFATWGLRYFDFRDFATENSLVLNMFFIKSRGHMWFLQQEVAFYVLAPFILLLIGLVKLLLEKISQNKIFVNTIIFILLNIATYITYTAFSFTAILEGNGSKSPLLIWLFLIGMAFAYLLKVLRELGTKSSTCKKAFSVIATVYVLTFLIFTIASSETILALFNPALKGYSIGWTKMVLVTYLSAACIMFICLLSEDNIIRKVLGNKLFVTVGNISFSMYLLHGCMISYFEEISIYSRFVVVYVISLALAMMVYNYIEKPIINRTRS